MKKGTILVSPNTHAQLTSTHVLASHVTVYKTLHETSVGQDRVESVAFDWERNRWKPSSSNVVLYLSHYVEIDYDIVLAKGQEAGFFKPAYFRLALVITMVTAIGVIFLFGLMQGGNLFPLSNATVACADGTFTVDDNGYVSCDDGSGRFDFEASNSFSCTPQLDGDRLVCTTSAGANFVIAGPIPATPIPPSEEELAEELAQYEDEPSGPTSWTSFSHCGGKLIGVSTLETLGGGNASCSNTTVTVNLPVSVDHLYCSRFDLGWACGAEGQSFRIVAEPTY